VRKGEAMKGKYIGQYAKGSRRRCRAPEEYTYEPLGCRKFRCNQMELDDKEAITRQPLKHRRLYEEYGRPHRLAPKKEKAPKQKEKKATDNGRMKTGYFLGVAIGYYGYLCPYCDRINSRLLKELHLNCDYCSRPFMINA